MKTTRFVAVATTAVLATLFTRDASAAGFALDVVSGRGTGMGSAQTGYIDDSSAIFYNPAGIAQGKVFDAQVGVSLIAPSFSYKSPSGEKTTLPFSVVRPSMRSSRAASPTTSRSASASSPRMASRSSGRTAGQVAT